MSLLVMTVAIALLTLATPQQPPLRPHAPTKKFFAHQPTRVLITLVAIQYMDANSQTSLAPLLLISALFLSATTNWDASSPTLPALIKILIAMPAHAIGTLKRVLLYNALTGFHSREAMA